MSTGGPDESWTTAPHSPGRARSLRASHTAYTPTCGPCWSSADTEPRGSSTASCRNATTAGPSRSGVAPWKELATACRSVTSASRRSSSARDAARSATSRGPESADSRRTCGSQLSHVQSVRSSPGTAAAIARSCGLCSVASWIPTLRARAADWRGSPAMPSTPASRSEASSGAAGSSACRRATRAASSRSSSSPPSASSRSTLAGRSNQPARSSSQSASSGRRSQRLGSSVTARSASVAVSGELATRSSASAAAALPISRSTAWRRSRQAATRFLWLPWPRFSNSEKMAMTGDSSMNAEKSRYIVCLPLR
ncbi:MAG: hypothetical protein E6J41_14915 [Chloroflexi bacterium]|nr:MAG: hypothetical protein E6J41_14915 [Chloroflexota bacterium]